MPGQLNVVSVSTAPASSSAICRPMIGDDRHQRVAEGVVAHHLALRDAARLGRLDVVALHGLQDVDPDQPDEDTARSAGPA